MTAVPPRGDFLVDDAITIEVGGKNKGASQITGIDQAWLALDDIEIGQGERIPLWLFGSFIDGEVPSCPYPNPGLIMFMYVRNRSRTDSSARSL